MSEFNRESTLHAQLKQLYAGIGGQLEVPVGSYICDCRTEYGELIEIQTGSFGPLKHKLQCIAQSYRVKIVHPIVCSCLIETYSADKVLLRKRQSPKKGSSWDLFKALLHAPELVKHKNISLELVALDITETRIDNGNGSWRRKGISLADKRLRIIHDTRLLHYPDDYEHFIPFNIEETFTTRDFFNRCQAIRSATKPNSEQVFSIPALETLTYPTAQKAVYVLYRIGLLERIGRKGKSYLYRINK